MVRVITQVDFWQPGLGSGKSASAVGTRSAKTLNPKP